MIELPTIILVLFPDPDRVCLLQAGLNLLLAVGVTHGKTIPLVMGPDPLRVELFHPKEYFRTRVSYQVRSGLHWKFDFFF
jgi:hypothetical protein